MINKLNGKRCLIKESLHDNTQEEIEKYYAKVERALKKHGFVYDESSLVWKKPLDKNNLTLEIYEGNANEDEYATITIQGIVDANKNEPGRAQPGYFALCDEDGIDEFSDKEEAIDAIGRCHPDRRYYGEEDSDPTNCDVEEIDKAYDMITALVRSIGRPKTFWN